MKQLHNLSLEERIMFFKVAAEESKLPLVIIEKDFWVVWILERLFSLKELESHLTFKGGTSLSKVYKLIERFSEDIDISIEMNFLGFKPEDDPEKAPSKKKQRHIIEEIGRKCSAYVQNKMYKDLNENIAEKIETSDSWKLTVDSLDPDGQTLLFEYPTDNKKDGYILPFVKIELGARSEHWPVSEHKIQSYAKDILKDKIHEAPVSIRVLNAERTFWEKATICTHLPEDKKIPARISRHYSDFYCLLNSKIKDSATQNIALLERVAIHKSIYFAAGWANYSSARKGSLKLIPGERLLKYLEDDFNRMKHMYFGNIPDWNIILKTIGEYELEFNK